MRLLSIAQSAVAVPCASFVRSGCLALVTVASLTASAQAEIAFYDIFKVESYEQANDNQPASPIGYFGTAGVTATNPTDLTGGQVTGASPLSPMTIAGSGGDYVYYTPAATTLAELDAFLPNSTTYTYALSGGSFDGQSALLTTPASDTFASTVPYFTNNAYTSLQGVSTANAITLSWNPYVIPAGVDASLIFIDLTRVSDGVSVFSTSGDSTLTSTTIPAHLLQSGTQYDLSLVYSARVMTQDTGFNSATAFVGFDRRTDLHFTTAVPEPSSSILLGCGIGLIGVAWRRRTTR